MAPNYLFIFPADPFNRNIPDEEYKKEYNAAKQYFTVGLLQLDLLVESEKIKLNRSVTEKDRIVYRGWMLTPSQYDLFEEAVEQNGASMLTGLSAYKKTHLLPNWADQPHTLRAKWTEDLSNKSLLTLLAHFDGAVTVKDFVKSRKH